MSRDINTNITDALNDAVVQPFFTLDLLFDDPKKLYFWSGIGDLSLDGNTYTGAGELLSISELRESSDIASYGATLTLSGIPNNLIDLALSEPYQGRRAVVKFGIQDTSTGTRYASTVFVGEMDQMNISMGPRTCTISLDVESRLVDLNRPRLRRYTDADQKSRFSGDDAFEFVTRLQNEALEWKG